MFCFPPPYVDTKPIELCQDLPFSRCCWRRCFSASYPAVEMKRGSSGIEQSPDLQPYLWAWRLRAAKGGEPRRTVIGPPREHALLHKPRIKRAVAGNATVVDCYGIWLRQVAGQSMRRHLHSRSRRGTTRIFQL